MTLPPSWGHLSGNNQLNWCDMRKSMQHLRPRWIRAEYKWTFQSFTSYSFPSLFWIDSFLWHRESIISHIHRPIWQREMTPKFHLGKGRELFTKCHALDDNDAILVMQGARVFPLCPTSLTDILGDSPFNMIQSNFLTLSGIIIIEILYSAEPDAQCRWLSTSQENTESSRGKRVGAVHNQIERIVFLSIICSQHAQVNLGPTWEIFSRRYKKTFPDN